MKKINVFGFIIVFIIMISCTVAGSSNNDSGKRKSVESPDSLQNISDSGNLVVVSSEEGLKIMNQDQKTDITLSKNAASSYYLNISETEELVGFKDFNNDMQAPFVYDVVAGQVIKLESWTKVCGTPAFSSLDEIAYTTNDTLVIKNSAFEEIERKDLGTHVNIINFSNDGNKIVYNDEDGNIMIYDRKSQRIDTFYDNDEFLWDAKFGLEDDLLFRSYSGVVYYANSTSVGKLYSTKKENGVYESIESIKWTLEGDILILLKKMDKDKIYHVAMEFDTSLTKISEYEVEDQQDKSIAVSSVTASVDKSGNIYRYLKNELKVTKKDMTMKNIDVKDYKSKNLSSDYTRNLPLKSKVSGGDSNYVIIDDVPYMNQCDDALDVFNGDAACNVTSALMCIQYYDVLPARNDWVSGFYSGGHISHYGYYQSQVYTYGRTFNIGSYDNSYYYAKGGYGYITQNNWADTKGHMAEYIEYHGIDSGVDWNPSINKARSEIDSGNPFVILVMIGTPSGHYVACTGYHKYQNTLVFNDPWGDGTPWSYNCNNGKQVVYDWPGYNYGNRNLGTVFCYIWARGEKISYFEKQSGALKDIGASNGRIWGVNAENNIYHKDSGEWINVPGKLVRITSDDDGNAWGINASQEIYRYDNGNWIKVDGYLTDIGVSGGEVWGVNASGNIYRYLGNDNWEQKNASFKGARIDVDADGDPWVVADDGSLHVFNYIGEWVQIAGTLSDIGFGGAVTWGVNPEGKIYRYEGSGVWTNFPASFIGNSITVDDDGVAYVTSSDNGLYRYNNLEIQ